MKSLTLPKRLTSLRLLTLPRWTIVVALIAVFVVTGWAQPIKEERAKPPDKSGGAFVGSESRARRERAFAITTIAYDFQDSKRDLYPMAVPNLTRTLSERAKLRVQMHARTIRLTDPALFRAPFLYITGYDCVMKLSDAEIANLGKYLRSGGFLFAEDIAPDVDRNGNLGGNLRNLQGGKRGTAFDQQMKAILRKALGPDAKFFVIPRDHALFHSFYDFDKGPPLGGAPWGNMLLLEGIEVGGRLAVAFSDLNISWYWGEKSVSGRERGLQFGVNLIVYALTQRGGIAHIGDYMKREE